MKKVPLHAKHVAIGGRMIPFVGWEMPVQYTSIVEEHLCVRQNAGLFDVSHMAKLVITGNQALAFLQRLSCNELTKIQDGEVQYNLILNPQGGVVDDVTIYRCHDKEFFMVINAANHDKIYAYLKEQLFKLEFEVEILDQSHSWSQLALQGPKADAILAEFIQQDLSHLKYFSFQDFHIDQSLVRISRTGYTGEDGFEIYADTATILELWTKLLEQGKTLGLMPIGLGARDSLRLEAFYPLYGNELCEDWTPVESGLGWVVKQKHPPYLGYERILEHKKNGAPGKIRGFQLEDKGLARKGYVVWDQTGNKQISQVQSAAYSPILKAGIGSLYLPTEYGQDEFVQIEIRNKRIPAHLHSGAFVRGTVKKAI